MGADHILGEIVAVCDMGSNSARLLLARVGADRDYETIDEYRVRVRLADDLDAERDLASSAVDRAIEAARSFALLIAAHDAARAFTVATGALRMARNGQRVVDRIQAETGLRFEIISGEEEAFYGYFGVVNTVGFTDATVVDVGGGTAQVVRVAGRQAVDRVSLPLGALLLKNAFLGDESIAPESLARLEEHLAASYRAIPWIRTAKRDENQESAPALIGMGGTVRNLGAIYQRQVKYPLDLLHGMVVPAPALQEIYRTLAAMSPAQRRSVPGLSPARADSIVAGAASVHALMQQVEASGLVVSTCGLREGLLFRQLDGTALQPEPVPDPAFAAARRLMRRFGVDAAHAEHVTGLAVSLFDQLSPVLALGGDTRRLLQIAGLLHDCGKAVCFDAHDANGFYLLTRTGIQGLSHPELVVVAMAIAAHEGEYARLRRGSACRRLLERDDPATVSKLGALLRLAECLDRSEAGAVRQLRAQIMTEGSAVRLIPERAADAELELREAKSALPEIGKALGIQITLQA
jgi:exopolyphosphatase/guanosine-5'-triphosphate,3'-diphosphate pyrophosphatase